MPLVFALLLMGFLSPSMQITITNFLKDGVKGTWDHAPPTAATLFFCSQDPPTYYRDIFRSNFTVKIATPSQWLDSLYTVQNATSGKLHTLVVDWQCPMADQLLRKATDLSLIRGHYRWLMLNITSDEQTLESCKDLAAEISANGSAAAEGKLADTDVVLVCRGSNSLLLVDVWGPIAPTILGEWIPELENRFQSNRFPPAVRRLGAGLNGYLFRPVFAIENNDTLEHFNDGVHKQYDFLSKFNYEVIHFAVEMMNGTVEVVFAGDWGYEINGTWTGTIGKLVRREAEIGGTPSTLSYSRLRQQTFLNYRTPATSTFVFREPPMSYIHNIFTRPFPRTLWWASVGLLTIGAVLLYGVLRVEENSGIEEHMDGPQIAEGRKRRLDASWSDVVLLSIGAVCQQGAPSEARSVSGRIVLLCILLGILFLYTSYTASIVALLQSTTSDIHHFKDFLGSRISLGVQNVSYMTHWIGVEKETIRRKIFLEKLTEHGRRNPFMTLEEGVSKMRNSYFAFLSARPNIYQEISDTFQEHEKCGLREVDNYFTLANPFMTLAKWSPHAEIMRIALRKIQERGIYDRQRHKFMSAKPLCSNLGGNFQSVSLVDCYGAFVVLCGGFGSSAFVLLVEKFVYPRIARLVKRNDVKYK